MPAETAGTDEANPLRVGLVHWAMPPTTGGVESHVADLAVALADLGCAVTVVTGEPAAVPLRGVEIVYLPLLDLGLRAGSMRKESGNEETYTHALGEIISSRRLDIIHGHNLHHFSANPALALDRLRRRLGFRLHHTFHETWPDVLNRHPVYRQWDGNYAVSHFVRDECTRHIGFTPEVRTLGIDVERFHARRLPMAECDEFVILHPARVLPWKGVHISVDMLEKLRLRGVAARLVITDTGRIIDWNDELVAYRERIVKMIRSYGISDVVEFRSAPYSDMQRLYDSADVVIYPTIGDEPYGLVPLEAMSMERPIVASRSGGMLETIVDGETGFLVQRGDSDSLADRVGQLLQDPMLCRRMGEAGRRHVVTHFNGRRYAAWLRRRYAPHPNEAQSAASGTQLPVGSQSNQ